MSSKADLRLDWATHAAAKYAVEHWHYSRTMPVSKSVAVGAWESGEFTGSILFTLGANPNLSAPYGLLPVECCELVRVAFRSHKFQTSRAVALSLKMLKKQSPGLRLVVSFADADQGHHGGIYQAGGWIYSGKTPPKTDFILRGKKLQRRAFTGKNFGMPKMPVPAGAVRVASQPKYRYLFPLDAEMRARILPLSKPYPKRDKQPMAGDQPAQGRGSADHHAPVLTEAMA